MSHRYFAYKLKNESFTRSQKLLPLSKIESLTQALLRSEVEIFKTVQLFDKSGTTLGSGLYADFDGNGCEEDVFRTVQEYEKRYGHTPIISYSGSKGFHLQVPVYVNHPKSHLIAKKFWKGLTHSIFLDEKVYTARRLFRVDGSIHLKTKLYKTRISKQELSSGIENIRRISKTQKLNRTSIDTQHIKEDLFKDIQVYINLLNEELNKLKEYKASSELNTKDYLPCIHHLLTQEPNDGDWNETITWLARYFNSRDFDLYEALDIMFDQEHWLEDQRHVKKVFQSVFRNISKFGCFSSNLLQSHCCISCPYNEEIYDFTPN